MITPISFVGIHEKLKRSAENIRNLEREIDAFFESGEYRVVPYDDSELVLKAVEYHQKRPIPARFPVLVGEVIHHLRSCLDHIVWQFSGDWYRIAKPTQIEFPILEMRPVNKKGLTGYERQVKGVVDPGALILIEYFQPYNAPSPIDSPLLILHKLDVTDKHRALVLCATTGAVRIPMEAVDRYMRYQRGEPGSAPVDIQAELKRDPNVYPQISFTQFGSRGLWPVVQGLAMTQRVVLDITRRFEQLSRFEDPIL